MFLLSLIHHPAVHDFDPREIHLLLILMAVTTFLLVGAVALLLYGNFQINKIYRKENEILTKIDDVKAAEDQIILDVQTMTTAVNSAKDVLTTQTQTIADLKQQIADLKAQGNLTDEQNAALDNITLGLGAAHTAITGATDTLTTAVTPATPAAPADGSQP